MLNELNIKYNLNLFIYFFIIFKIHLYKINFYNKNYKNFYVNYIVKNLYNKVNFIIFYKTKLIYFNYFYLRIDLLNFLCLFKYICFFQLYKYKKYLNFLFYNYSLICCFFNYINQINWKTLYSNKAILNKFQIYNKINYSKKKINKLNINFIKKNKNIKHLFVYTNKCFIFLFFFIKFIFNLFIFFFFYNTWYNQNKYNSIKNMHLYSIINILSIKSKNLNNDILNVRFNYNTQVLNFNNHIWSNLIQFIIIEYIDVLFFKFFNEINYYKVNYKFKKMWINCWIILKRSFIFDWIRLYNFTYLNLINDEIIWKIFYLNLWFIHKYLNFNIYNLNKQINLNKNLYNKVFLRSNLLVFIYSFIKLLKVQQSHERLIDKKVDIIKFVINLFIIFNFIYLNKIKNNKQINYKLNYIYVKKKNKNLTFLNKYKTQYYYYFKNKYNLILIIIFFYCFVKQTINKLI